VWDPKARKTEDERCRSVWDQSESGEALRERAKERSKEAHNTSAEQYAEDDLKNT